MPKAKSLCTSEGLGMRGHSWKFGMNRGNSQLVKHKRADTGEDYPTNRDAKNAIWPSCRKEDGYRQLINPAIQYI